MLLRKQAIITAHGSLADKLTFMHQNVIDRDKLFVDLGAVVAGTGRPMCMHWYMIRLLLGSCDMLSIC
jgi:hypothetical protein